MRTYCRKWTTAPRTWRKRYRCSAHRMGSVCAKLLPRRTFIRTWNHRRLFCREGWARRKHYTRLWATNAPAVYLGAEVAYFPGISRYAQIRDLCIAGSRCILIEMPFDEWTTTVTDEIIALHECAGLLPVLAHIERYTYHERVLKNLLAHHVLIQSNSAFFYSFRTKRRALRMLKREEIHLLGSDCHNMHTRIPDLARCAEVIQKRCGEAFLQSCAAFGETLLKDAVPLDVLMKKEFLEPGSVSLDA